jgi:hypothetical protein
MLLGVCNILGTRPLPRVSPITLGQSPAYQISLPVRRSLYQWTTLPFSIRNGPAAFQRLLDSILAGLTFECCLIYLDDIIIVRKSFEQHMDALDKVLPLFVTPALR